MLWDAANLSYLVLRTGVKGAFYGGSYIYDLINEKPKLPALPEPPQSTSSTSALESKLMQAFQNVPLWTREKILIQGLYNVNTENLTNFCFGNKGSTIFLKFLEMRTLSSLALVSIRLDLECTIEQLRNALKEYQSRVNPDLFACAWYLNRRLLANSDQLTEFQESLEEDSRYSLPVVKITIDF